jgi:hypothetical protein
MKSNRNLSRLMIIALLSGILTNCGLKQPITTQTPTETITPSLTLTLTNTIAPTLTGTSAPGIVGKWKRHGKQNEKPYTEIFDLRADGTYSIDAIFDNTGKTLASTYGTYIFTETTLTLTDKDNKSTISPYYVDATGNKLIISNMPEFVWTRVQ